MHFDLMKNNMAALNNELVVQIDLIFLPYLHKKVFCSNPELKFFSILLLYSLLKKSLFSSYV